MNIRKRFITGVKMADAKELKAKAMGLEPAVRIGKSGLSDSVVEEIKKHIKQKGLVKVKMLRSFVGSNDKKALAEEIAEKTGSTLVGRIGFAVVLARK
jgi:RNA-binding protein